MLLFKGVLGIAASGMHARLPFSLNDLRQAAIYTKIRNSEVIALKLVWSTFSVCQITHCFPSKKSRQDYSSGIAVFYSRQHGAGTVGINIPFKDP